MNQEHTPGPWTLHKRESIYGDFHYITGPDGKRLNERAGSPEGNANARLMAAAPDLLAALTALVEDIDPHKRANDPELSSHALIISARRAIAKAEGGAD